MDEVQVQELVRDGLKGPRKGWLPEMNQAKTFEEAEIATANRGLVLAMNDGPQIVWSV